MHIKISMIFGNCRHPDRACGVVDPGASTSFNIREEYANTFRTESYNEFWARVVDLTFTHEGSNGSQRWIGSTSAAARLPSYRLFVEHLLDPNQQTITKILAQAMTTQVCDTQTHALLSDYYSETTQASLLCSRLLRDIERLRLLYRPLKTLLHSLVSNDVATKMSQLRAIDRYLSDLSKTLDPFDSLASFRTGASHNLVKRLESGRKKLGTKLRVVNRLKYALAVFLVVITASTSVIGVHMAVHGLVALLFVMPTSFLPSCRMLSTRWLARVQAQLDAAAKGTYILNRDMDTISRLVARMHDEVDHMVALLGLCRDDRRLTTEVVRQIRKNDTRFNEQVDELEEHLYLWFMTINKARSLVMKEVLVSMGAKTNGS